MASCSPATTSSFPARTPTEVPARRGSGHRQGLRLPVGLQRRRRRPAARAPGQDRGGRPARRGFGLRGDRGLRQGGLHPHRLLQPGEAPGADPEQRRRSAHRQAAGTADRASGGLRLVRRALRRPGSSQVDHFVDVKLRGNAVWEHMPTPRRPRRPFSRSSPTTASPRASTTTPAAPATTPATSRALASGTLTDSLSADQAPRLRRRRDDLAELSRCSDRFRMRRAFAAALPTRRPSTATTTIAPTTSWCAASRPSSPRWTAGPTVGAASTTSTCCPRPATSTSAR
jgi:hypothetical protein